MNRFIRRIAMRLVLSILTVSIVVVTFGCAGEGGEPSESDAATGGTSGIGNITGGNGGAGGSDGGKAGVGGVAETDAGRAGQSGNPNGGSDANVSDAVIDVQLCPPCMAPPSPSCVGTGPCGCGPYDCPDAGGSSYHLQCNSTDSEFPPFSKSCESDEDCVLLGHQIDCCGSFTMIGVSVSDQEKFEAAESQCSSSFPMCECAQQPTIAEDGLRANDIGAFAVVCNTNQCSSTIDPEAISESDLNFCQRDSDCVVVPYSHCCGSTKTAINKRYLDAYNAHPEWQVFNDPATCAVIGVCRDDSNVTDAVCEFAPEGICQLEY